MTLVSTFKPHHECGEYARNQRAALASWVGWVDRVIYVGCNEPELYHPKVMFTNTQDPPWLRHLVNLASETPGLSAIINGDIILGRGFPQVVQKLSHLKFKAATSRRWQFTPGESPMRGSLEDYGLDVFVASQDVWKKVAGSVPGDLRLGNILWDTWMAGFFSSNFGNRYIDFTGFKCVFHPRHGSRGHQQPVRLDKFMAKAALPGRKL